MPMSGVFEGVGNEAAHVPLVLGHPAHDADARLEPVDDGLLLLARAVARQMPSRSRAISSASR